MKDNEINELFPEKADKEKLINLMQIVNEAITENKITARLVDNIQDLAGTASEVAYEICLVESQAGLALSVKA